MGHHDLPRLPGRQYLAMGVDDLDDDVFGRDVHTSPRTGVGDEARIAATIAIGHGTCKYPFDLLALVIIEPLRGNEGHADAQVIHGLSLTVCMAGDMGQGRGIPEQHARANTADGAHEFIQFRLRHLEGRQQMGTQHTVTPIADTVLAAQFNGGTPDHHLGIADIHVPPAGGAPLGGHIMAHPILADEEDQGFTAGTAGIEACQTTGLCGSEFFLVRTDQRFVQERQLAQVIESLDIRAVQP